MAEEHPGKSRFSDGSGPSGKAHMITVAVGAETRQFRNCLVEIVPSLGVVNIWRDEPRRHVATAPLASTMIEWEAPQETNDLDDSIW
jgi:hypothetical protein